MKMRKELNNKGFSLLELLIATMILGIVVVPLLHTFVVSAETTARSGKLGDAVLASENIAEGMDGATIDELIKVSDISGYIPGASEQKLYKSNGAGGYTVLEDDDVIRAPYHLGMKMQTGSSVFNAMVTLDPAAYGASSANPLNAVMLADYSNMDGAFVQTRDGDDPDKLAEAIFEDALQGVDWDEDSVEPVRTMTLTITEDSNKKIFADLDLEYEYTYRYTEVVQVDEDTQESVTKIGSFKADADEQPHYELMPQGFSVEENNTLPNLYLIYYPLYKTASVTNDIIIVNNETKRPIKIFLVKQRDPNESVVLSGEPHYHATVQQYVPAGTAKDEYAVIYSNIREDLNNKTRLSGVSYRVYRGNWFHEDLDFGDTFLDGGCTEEGDLVSMSARDRIFKATVAIYDSSDTTFTTPIHTFETTKLQ